MDWLYWAYEIVSTIFCLAFCAGALATCGWWSWLVWAPRSERVCAAFRISDAKTERRVEQEDAAKENAGSTRSAPFSDGRVFRGR